MSRNQSRGNSSADFDRARDELFQHINRCGVLRASAEQQAEWMDDTVEYVAECYPALTREQLGELRAIGLRFCRPVIDSAQSAAEAGAEEADGSTEASAAAA